MRRIPPDRWAPKGVGFLEPNALRALRSEGSVSVVAGPGAGKTEFLAQKAAYLLETGICTGNRKILAISFKTDAASNLAKRVAMRCPAELARRFVSMTFDAFTKSLVDRFYTAVPELWRPSRSYEILFPDRRYYEDFLSTTRLGAPTEFQAEIAGIGTGTFESGKIGNYRLPLARPQPANGTDHAILAWWDRMLNRRRESSMSFVGLNRLAELLLRSNPELREALRATYQFVFVDEFQDTTFAQYDFLLSVFGGSPAVLTAVGDNKQRIMAWAGARTDAFQRFERDFRAQAIPLTYNFRSSPDLVRIQHVVARALDPGSNDIEAQTASRVDGDVAQLWTSDEIDTEAAYIATWLAEDMRTRGLAPRDYVILVRQRADRYEDDLTPAFAEHGLRIRNESRLVGEITLQDLLAEELCRIVVSILRLGAVRQNAAAWRVAAEALQNIRGINPEDAIAYRKVEASLTEFIAGLRQAIEESAPSPEHAKQFSERVFTFLDLGAIRRSFSHYSLGNLLAIVVEAFSIHLSDSSKDAESWSECLDRFEGVDQIPLMTVHKSKGLEFDTMLFVGLDDRAWWSHSRENPEGLATFFVALSRAKQRAIFAFCSARGGRGGIADLYELLSAAGVPEIRIENDP